MALSAACTGNGTSAPDTSVADSVPASPAPSAGTQPSTSAPAAGGPALRISEVHYHSVDDDPASEFVELFNAGDQALELQGWCVKGINFCFVEPERLDPSGYRVIRQDQIEGNLSNNGERLSVVDPLGQLVDVIDYDDGGIWPVEADGGGLSLNRSSFDSAGDSRDAWTAALPTPGAAIAAETSVPAGEVAITEVNYHPKSGNPDEVFVEVVNVGTQVVDLKGWCLRGTGFCWERATVLIPGETAAAVGVFAEGDLSRRQERIRVVDNEGRVHDTAAYQDRGEWPALADGYGYSLNRRNAALPGTEPGNWEIGEPTPTEPPTALDRPLLPVFRDVDFTVAPAAGEPIRITARVSDATAARLEYVVGFGPAVEASVRLDEGVITAEVPGQSAGSLVRFRLLASGRAEGSWPRAGDGAAFGGTVVAAPTSTGASLSTMQWFVAPEVWAEAKEDKSLQGNNGYPAVMAFEGVVVDNVTIRIKGNQARTNYKKKWKVMLPAGHTFDAAGRIEEPVDQFDLLNAATDKSFSRELLVYDMQRLSGGLAQQVFPVQLDVNGGFFGLYMYGESPEGTWRDRHGFSDSTYVWKAEGRSMLIGPHADLPQGSFRGHYERNTQRHLKDNDQLLRDLIETINSLEGDKLVEWALRHLDIPEIVEALATMRIVQHSEWQHKNYLVLYDPADERWRLVPIDFDLTFGRRWQSPCNARCDTVSAQGWLYYPGGNRLARVILQNAPFRAMVDRRTRELAEVYLEPGRIENRLEELNKIMGAAARRDRSKWGAFGEPQTMKQAQQVIVNSFLRRKREIYIGKKSPLPKPQPSSPTLGVEVLSRAEGGRVQSARITNSSEIAVDVSNRWIREIGAVLPAGTVIPAGWSVSIAFNPEDLPKAPAPEWWVLGRRSEKEPTRP